MRNALAMITALMAMAFPAVWSAVWCGHVRTFGQNLLTNGGFEEGLNSWTTAHMWYEAKVDGRGTGISGWEVDEQIAHDGRRSARVTGKGNRGIALMVLRLPPATYRASGWIRCQNLTGASASILVEFLDKNGKWMQGVTVGAVRGTAEWTRVEKEIAFPPETAYVHFDLLTDAPNTGTAWFDGVELVPILDTVVPAPVEAAQQPSDAGEIRLTWRAPAPTGIARYEIYIEPQPFRSVSGRRPRAVVDWTTNEAAVRLPGKGGRAFGAVVAVGVNGRRQEEVKPMELSLKDSRPPRPATLEVRPSAARPGTLLVEWEPCPLDEDIAALYLYASAGSAETTAALKPHGKARPARERTMWLSRKSLPAGVKWIGLAVADAAGNRSAPVWKPIPAPLPTGTPDADIWVASPLHNVFRDTPKPPDATTAIDLLSARNEAEGAQIVLHPRAALSGVSVEVEPLVHENGRARIGVENIVWNFVGYLHVEKNSTATPPEELLRKAPADFPDPFLEERVLDLEPGRNQPIFVRVFTPKGAAAGTYRGAIHILTSQGSVRIPIRLEVLPVTLPDQLPLYVTNWFNVGNIARYHSLPEWSEEFWRTLRLYAREMKRGHQNVVLTPLDLVKIWREEDGSLTFDYTDFDRWVRLFGAEGVAERVELSHLGGRTTGEWECPTFSISPRPATDRRTGQAFTVEVEQFLPDLQQHLEERGWLERTVLHIGDEPILKNVASWREQSARAHRAAPKMKRIDAIHVPAPEVKDHLEVLVPQLNYFAQWLEGYREAQRSGSELWFYIAWVPQGKFTNRLIDLACIKTRLIHWINFLYGATGYLHWGLNFWTDFKEMGFAPGDNWIIYPGKWGPRSSLRWEAMRDGLEDFACFHLLAQKKPKRARELARQVMRDVTDYDKDPAHLERARRQAARELAGLR